MVPFHAHFKCAWFFFFLFVYLWLYIWLIHLMRLVDLDQMQLLYWNYLCLLLGRYFRIRRRFLNIRLDLLRYFCLIVLILVQVNSVTVPFHIIWNRFHILHSIGLLSLSFIYIHVTDSTLHSLYPLLHYIFSLFCFYLIFTYISSFLHRIPSTPSGLLFCQFIFQINTASALPLLML